MDNWQLAKERTAGWPELEEVPLGVRLNLGSGRIILANDAGWVNVDIQPNEGVDVQCNLFEFPWPFEDNYADYAIASHLVEHIPHQVMVRQSGEIVKGYEKKRYSGPEGWRVVEEPVIESYNLRLPHHLDGFLAFFKEVHRILKPNGVITVICPFGFSTGALQDPTHCRYIVAETFSYLAPNPTDPFDYGLDFRFEAVGGATYYLDSQLQSLFPPQRAQAVAHQVNAVHSIRVDLRAIKG